MIETENAQTEARSNREKVMRRFRAEFLEELSEGFDPVSINNLLKETGGCIIHYDGTFQYFGPPIFSDKPPIVPEEERPYYY